MPSPYSKKKYSALTIRGQGGLLREIRTPIRVRVPLIIKGAAHNYVDVEAIWDTGATNCVISNELASELDLKPISKKKVIGVHGEQVVDIFIVDFEIMGVTAENWTVSSGDLGGAISVLLGMDIIRTGDFSITTEKDANGILCTVFTFRYPSMEAPIDYRAEIDRYNFEVKSKQTNKNLRAEYSANRSSRRKKNHKRK